MESGFVKKDCGCSGLSESPVMDAEEQEKAKKTTEDAVKTAQQYSNPAVPLPLKLTGIALLIFILTR
jgi:hypothetical protein